MLMVSGQAAVGGGNERPAVAWRGVRRRGILSVSVLVRPMPVRLLASRLGEFEGPKRLTHTETQEGKNDGEIRPRRLRLQELASRRLLFTLGKDGSRSRYSEIPMYRSPFSTPASRSTR